MSKRGSGRTTRMLSEAKTLVETGRAVYVIAANQQHVELLKSSDIGKECLELGVKFETPSSPGNFDWREMRLLGAHPSCAVLVDHYTIECHFAKVLEMLHRFD